jgi:DNA-binding response OmpR family regulator
MSKRRILIVDDEADIRAIVRATLSAKYEVVEAQDGLDAAEKLDLVEPDFVVLDVMMPLMDGFETCQVIRNHPRFCNTSVLFLSALNTKEDMVKGYGAGANLYLTKPFDPSRLLRNVDVFFEEKSPPVTHKRFTLEEIREIERQGPSAISAAKASGKVPSAAPPPAAPAPPPVAEPSPPPARPEADSSVADQTEKPWYADKKITSTAETSEELSATATPPAVEPSAPARTRILVVDDDEEIVTVVCAALDPDYEVITANNGIEAIEKITTYQPDIVVLDALLPKMSGYQLCQSLRHNARYSKTPILFISGKTTPRDRDYALRVGGTDFLPKPFEASELKKRIIKLTHHESFILHPKTLNADQIFLNERRKKKELENRQDRLHMKQETELEKFLRENA